MQQFVYDHADGLHHRVCIVLEHYSRRLYTSFSDAGEFWNYYSTFRGKRCFYWINRSYEKTWEASLLHLDIEWYTNSRDTQTAHKLLTICKAVNAALPCEVEILREDLSRDISPNKFKNSFHLYAMVTLSHNAKTCMQPFVTEKIWGSLKHMKSMYCGLTKKPIIDLGIYTKNRNFRVPGSSKYHGFKYVPLPTRAFFMATRMADRLENPDLSIEQLNLKGSMTISSSTVNLKRQRVKRKRH